VFRVNGVKLGYDFQHPKSSLIELIFGSHMYISMCFYFDPRFRNKCISNFFLCSVAYLNHGHSNKGTPSVCQSISKVQTVFSMFL
jgi:hypothetical protein